MAAARSAAEVVRQLLIDRGVAVAGTYAANTYTGQPWPAFASAEPDEPDECITVYDTTAQSDGRIAFTGEVAEHPGIQIRVRAKDHLTGQVRAELIRTSLAAVYDALVTISSTAFLVRSFYRFGGILAIGKDSPRTRRSLFTMNMMMALEQESAADYLVDDHGAYLTAG